MDFEKDGYIENHPEYSIRSNHQGIFFKIQYVEGICNHIALCFLRHLCQTVFENQFCNVKDNLEGKKSTNVNNNGVVPQETANEGNGSSPSEGNKDKYEIKDHFALEALHSGLLVIDEGSEVGDGNGKARPDDCKNLISVGSGDEAYEELKGQLR